MLFNWPVVALKSTFSTKLIAYYRLSSYLISQRKIGVWAHLKKFQRNFYSKRILPEGTLYYMAITFLQSVVWVMSYQRSVDTVPHKLFIYNNQGSMWREKFEQLYSHLGFLLRDRILREEFQGTRGFFSHLFVFTVFTPNTDCSVECVQKMAPWRGTNQ